MIKKLLPLIFIFSYSYSHADASLRFGAVTGSRAELTSPDYVNNTTTFSAVLWQLPEILTGNTPIYRKDSNPATANLKNARIDPSGDPSKISVTMARLGTSASSRSLTNFLTTNKWSGTCITYDFDTGTIIYLKTSTSSAVNMTETNTLGTGGPTTDGNVLWVGNSPAASPGVSYPGSLAYFKWIVGRKISRGECEELLANPFASINSSGTVVDLQLGFNGNGTQFDQSGYKNNATVTGAVGTIAGPAVTNFYGGFSQ